MKKNKREIIFFVLLPFLLLSSCGFIETETSWSERTVPEEEEVYEITEMDLSTEEEGAVEIDFKEEGNCLLEEGGTYILSGDYEGQIQVDVKEYPIHLILDNVTVQSFHGPALCIRSASKVVLTLKEGTENKFVDSPEYGGQEEGNGCIYSENDLTINGKGSLCVYGNKKSAISSKDCIKILDGKIQIQSKKDGIRANDGIVLSPQNLTVKSEGNGIVTRKSGKKGKGCLKVCGGEISVVAGKNAIASAHDLYIRDCRLTLKSILKNYSWEGELNIQKGCITNE